LKIENPLAATGTHKPSYCWADGEPSRDSVLGIEQLEGIFPFPAFVALRAIERALV